MSDRPISDEDVILDEDGFTTDFVREWNAHEAGFVSDEIEAVEAWLEADDGVQDAVHVGGPT